MTTACICHETPLSMQYSHMGATDPASMLEPNPECRVHFPMTTLAEQVAGLEVGDWVEARYVFSDGSSATYVDYLRGKSDMPKLLEIDSMTIRYRDGAINRCLTSITRVPRPIPSEPEVGFVAWTDDQRIVKRFRSSDETAENNWFQLVIVGNPTRFSWPEIYPSIIKLYTPSGDEVTEFEYYKSEGN